MTRRPSHLSRETGSVIVAVLYGLSLFSILSLTALTNVVLEKKLRESTEPDLHLVLYLGGARTPEIFGRLNLPTVWRELEGAKDRSIELRSQAPLDMDSMTALPPGWSYAVQLPQGARVCCDGGDNACADPAALLRVYDGSVTPALERRVETTDATQRLRFKVSAFDLAENVELDSSSASQPGLPIKVVRLPEAVQAEALVRVDSHVSCRLESDEKVIATGTLQFTAGQANGEINYVSSGSVELEYRTPLQIQRAR